MLPLNREWGTGTYPNSSELGSGTYPTSREAGTGTYRKRRDYTHWKEGIRAGIPTENMLFR